MNRMKGLIAAAITAALLASGSGFASAQTPADQMMGRHSVEGEVTKGGCEERLGPREDVRRHDDHALPAG